MDGTIMHQESKRYLNLNKIYKIQYNMQITNYTQTDTYFVFEGVNGEIVIAPTATTIIVEEEGTITFKNTASRCTIAYLVK